MVNGVKENDSLNIREKSNVKSKIVGKIPHDGTNIFLSSPDSFNNQSKWCEIQYNKIVGWINKKYLVEVSFNSPSMHLKCFGNEPYWKITVHDGTLELTDRNSQKRSFIIKDFKRSLNNTNQWYLCADSKTDSELHIFLKEEGCSDDMSDNEHKYQIMIYDVSNKETINGCCNDN
jgi:uncharacterized membrane protein